MLPASSCKSSCKCYLVDSHLLLQHVPALGVFFFQAELSLVGFVLHLSSKPFKAFELLLRLVELPLDLRPLLLVLRLGRLDQNCGGRRRGRALRLLPSVAEPSSRPGPGPTSSASRKLLGPASSRLAPASSSVCTSWLLVSPPLVCTIWSLVPAPLVWTLCSTQTMHRVEVCVACSRVWDPTRTRPNGCHAPTQTSGESPRTASPGAIARPRSRMLVQSSRGRRTSALRPWIETQSELRLSRSR